jgi:hypothetical protein
MDIPLKDIPLKGVFMFSSKKLGSRSRQIYTKSQLYSPAESEQISTSDMWQEASRARSRAGPPATCTQKQKLNHMGTTGCRRAMVVRGRVRT